MKRKVEDWEVKLTQPACTRLQDLLVDAQEKSGMTLGKIATAYALEVERGRIVPHEKKPFEATRKSVENKLKGRQARQILTWERVLLEFVLKKLLPKESAETVDQFAQWTPTGANKRVEDLESCIKAPKPAQGALSLILTNNAGRCWYKEDVKEVFEPVLPRLSARLNQRVSELEEYCERNNIQEPWNGSCVRLVRFSLDRVSSANIEEPPLNLVLGQTNWFSHVVAGEEFGSLCKGRTLGEIKDILASGLDLEEVDNNPQEREFRLSGIFTAHVVVLSCDGLLLGAVRNPVGVKSSPGMRSCTLSENISAAKDYVVELFQRDDTDRFVFPRFRAGEEGRKELERLTEFANRRKEVYPGWPCVFRAAARGVEEEFSKQPERLFDLQNLILLSLGYDLLHFHPVAFFLLPSYYSAKELREEWAKPHETEEPRETANDKRENLELFEISPDWKCKATMHELTEPVERAADISFSALRSARPWMQTGKAAILKSIFFLKALANDHGCSTAEIARRLGQRGPQSRLR